MVWGELKRLVINKSISLAALNFDPLGENGVKISHF